MPERSGNAECSQPVSGCTDSSCLHCASPPFQRKPLSFSSDLFPLSPPLPPTSICRISVILLGPRWGLGQFLVGFSQVTETRLHPGPCLLPGAFPPFLVGALGCGCQGVTRLVWACHLCHLRAHRNSSFCWQGQPFLAQFVHLLNFSRFRYIPMQKTLPFFLLPSFHRRLNVKSFLLSFFPLLCDDGGCRSWGWPGLPSLS